MKWQEHSQISLLAGSGSAALSDFEHEGERRRRSRAAVRVCPGGAVSGVQWRRRVRLVCWDAAGQLGNLCHEALYGYRAS